MFSSVLETSALINRTYLSFFSMYLSSLISLSLISRAFHHILPRCSVKVVYKARTGASEWATDSVLVMKTVGGEDQKVREVTGRRHLPARDLPSCEIFLWESVRVFPIRMKQIEKCQLIKNCCCLRYIRILCFLV